MLIIVQITTTNGTPTLALPLAIVLVANMAKDFFEDWKRHKADRVENLSISLVVPTEKDIDRIKGQSRLQPAFLSYQEEGELEMEEVSILDPQENDDDASGMYIFGFLYVLQ